MKSYAWVRDLRVCFSRFKLPKSVLNEVERLYSKLKENKNTAGRPLEVTVACLVYYVCKRDLIPLTMLEISEIIEVDKHKIFRSYKTILRKLGLRNPELDVETIVHRFAGELGAGNEVVVKAVDYCKKTVRKGLMSSPTVIVGACLLLASRKLKKPIKIKDLRNVTNATPQAINKVIKDLKEEQY